MENKQLLKTNIILMSHIEYGIQITLYYLIQFHTDIRELGISVGK